MQIWPLQVKTISEQVIAIVLVSGLCVLTSVLMAWLVEHLMGFDQKNLLLCSALIPAVIAPIATTWFVCSLRHLGKLMDEAERLSQVDDLTGLARRGHFLEQGRRLAEQSRLFVRHVSIMIVDIDHFKLVNDRYGHATGDAAIINLAGLLGREYVPGRCVVGRLGGEEFGLVFSHDEAGAGAALAHDIQRTVAATPITDGNVTLNLTVSVGHTLIDPEECLDQWLRRADAALYSAKTSGRNRVCSRYREDESTDVVEGNSFVRLHRPRAAVRL